MNRLSSTLSDLLPRAPDEARVDETARKALQWFHALPPDRQWPSPRDVDWRSSFPSRYFPASGGTWALSAGAGASRAGANLIHVAQTKLAHWIATLPKPLEIVFFVNGKRVEGAADVVDSPLVLAEDHLAWLERPVAHVPPAAAKPHLPRPPSPARALEWLNLALGPAVNGLRFSPESRDGTPPNQTLALIHILAPEPGFSGPTKRLFAPLQHELRLAPDQQLHLFEATLDLGCGDTLVSTHSVLFARLERGSTLHHLRLDLGFDSTHGNALGNVARVQVGEGAAYRAWGWTTHQTRWSRQETWVRLQGRSARAEIQSWSAPTAAGTHADRLVSVEHLAPDTTSRQNLRTIVGSRATSTFAGRVFVAPEAQRTDASQVSRSLLLGDGAVSQARPELEIHADDVKCSHGATISQFDEEPLFYLRSRGIPPETAKALLVQAFSSDVLASLRPGPFEKTTELFENLAQGGTGA